MAESIRVLGRAKVNLFLRVGRRRADGYHDLETVFHSIALADSVVLRRVTGRDVALTCALDVPPAQNLAMRAARAFLDKAGEEGLGLAIDVQKSIPVSAGLGGGSADAAAVLVGLNHLLDHPFGTDELSVLGARLGADVPFCVPGGLALGEGIGDRLTAGAASDFDLVVVKPPVGVATAWAYQALDAHLAAGHADGAEEGGGSAVIARLNVRRAAALADLAANDFERVVLPAHPEVARARRALLDAGAAWALLAGSGAAVFGVFADGDAAARAHERLARELADHAVFRTRSAQRGAEVVG